MVKEIIFRNAEIADAENITVLKQQVWITTYAVEGIGKEFANYVLSEFTLNNIQKIILDSNKKTLIALIENKIIGCIEIAINSKCPVQSMNNYPEITILYIIENFCGLGIGEILLEKALIMLKKMNFNETWLTVYHKNNRAISFYKKHQFKEIGITDFELHEHKYENKVMSVVIK